MGHSHKQKHRRRGAPHSSKDVHVPCVCVCVYHVGQDNISRPPGICGEALACMSWECIRFQVDVIAGDGNKACYLATPKAGGCPTYEVSLLQFWIDRMIHTATEARIKKYGKRHHLLGLNTLFLVPVYKDLAFLAKTPRGVKTDTYTPEMKWRRKLKMLATVA